VSTTQERREAWEAVEESIRDRLLSDPGAEEMGDPATLYTPEDCPRCAMYRCEGMTPPRCQHWVTLLALCQMEEHSLCQDWWCDFGAVADQVVEVGLPYATAERPLVVVRLDGETLRASGAYADHRTGKPARTRAGGGHVRAEGWAHKSRAWLVCGRCRSLHGT
jgi:hypothetical protein